MTVFLIALVVVFDYAMRNDNQNTESLEKDFTILIEHIEEGGRTETIRFKSLDAEIRKTYDFEGELEYINYVANVDSSPFSNRIYDIYGGTDQRWRYFGLRQHLFKEGELDGEKGHTYLISACAVCHGQSGEGRIETLAPSLAGMPASYLETQLLMFRDGRRKAVPDDDHGHSHGDMMIDFLKEIELDKLKRLAKHYATLPSFNIIDQQIGDAKKGQEIYKKNCISCHFDDGRGNIKIGSPPLTIIPDWYVRRQIEAFQRGYRDVNSNNANVVGMIAAVKDLSNEDCDNLLAYLEKLVEK